MSTDRRRGAACGLIAAVLFLVGLIMALGLATVLVYKEPLFDRHQSAGMPHDRAQLQAATTTERPRA